MAGIPFYNNLQNPDILEWILDMGATNHMTYILDSLHNVRKVNNSKVNLPNGNCSFVTHIWDHFFKDTLILKNVLYVPEFRYNLLSISKLSNDIN